MKKYTHCYIDSFFILYIVCIKINPFFFEYIGMGDDA